jgi:hypothetical protein
MIHAQGRAKVARYFSDFSQFCSLLQTVAVHCDIRTVTRLVGSNHRGAPIDGGTMIPLLQRGKAPGWAPENPKTEIRNHNGAACIENLLARSECILHRILISDF